MNSCKSLEIGYNYVFNHYMDFRQLEYYTHRVFEKGLSEAEKVLLQYYFSTDDKIIDIGTGCGRFAINAYSEGFHQMYGIDMIPKFIERADDIAFEKKSNIKFSVQNAEKTNFLDREFESAIFTSDGFSQVPGNERKLAVLNEIYRIMRPNGVFILAVIDENLVRKNAPAYAEMIDNFRKKSLWKTHHFYDKNDVYIYDGGYMHFASIEETTDLINQTRFHLLFNASAKDILGYNDKLSMNVSRFFILRK